VKNVVTACLFKMMQEDVDASDYAISNAIGASRHQIQCGKDRVEELLTKQTTVTALERKERKDKIRIKVEAYIFDFLKDDSYTRLDTKQGLADVIDPKTAETITVHRRIWRNVNKRQQHLLFLSSDYYARFRQDHNQATVGYDVWHDALANVGGFVSKPLNESCVDEKISGMEHYMAALLQ